MAVIELNDSTFDEELAGSDQLTVVDFWAPWCGPCRMVAPVIEELAQEMDGTVRFAKLNVDEAPQIAGRYRVMSIPTIAFFRGSEPLGAVVGAQPKAALQQIIDQMLQEEPQEA